MPSPRLLVIEGNTAESRAQQIDAGGVAASQGYADLLRTLVPGAFIDICYPADPGKTLPAREGLESYDGIAITGSALHVYHEQPVVRRQVELVRALMETGTPAFGSCWGLQVLTAAAGGSVRRNPRGRELGFGRSIRLTPQGRAHPMYGGKADVFDAVTVHLDEVETLPPGATVLATNGVTHIQAAEIRNGTTWAWAVQYHPEYPLREVAAIVRRTGTRLVAEGFFTDAADLTRYAGELDALDRDPRNKALAWRHGIDGAVLDRTMQTKELANWVAHAVLPTRTRRGRG